MKIDKSQLDRVSDQLFWSEQLGLGTGPASQRQLYDLDYWLKYRGYDRTAMGQALTEARLDFVNKWAPDCDLVDIGIGGGLFVSWAHCCGYDVNPYAREWLAHNGGLFDPLREICSAMSMWDSLEHIVDPAPILRSAKRYVFISTPIYRDLAHVLHSKHFRPGEHVFYFTERGLKTFMELEGFECIDTQDFETRLGREDILSFAFRRLVGGCPESSPIA